MNSCLYQCDIMHARLRPKVHKFTHRIFMFYLDLSEIDLVSAKIRLFSHNRFNVYSFFDRDHLEIGGKTIEENLRRYLKDKGVQSAIKRIMLLTNVRTLGYIFNPVAFYFCFDRENKPVCVVPEIGNTFGELKCFFLAEDSRRGDLFQSQQVKHYYVSPFVDLDVDFNFQIRVPSERLEICIDSIQDGKPLIVTSMLGPRKELTNKNIFLYSLRCPLVTLKVIFLIHLHAFILWLKRLSYHPKEANPQLQQEVLRVWSKT